MAEAVGSDFVDVVLVLVKDVLAVSGEVVPYELTGVLHISLEAGIPSINKDLVDFLGVGGDGVWFGVVGGRSPCVGDLIGVFVFDVLVSLFGVLVIGVVVLFLVEFLVNVFAFGLERSYVIVVALELRCEDEGERRCVGVGPRAS